MHSSYFKIILIFLMTALFGYTIEVELTEYNGIRNGVKLYNKGEVIGKVTGVKQGNDGYYLEEWKKDIKSFIAKAEELNINYDLNQLLNQ